MVKIASELGKEWTNIDKGLISKETLEALIKKYFKVNEDLSKFKRRNSGYLEVMELYEHRGYVFVGELQLDRDYKERMQRVKNLFEKGYNVNILDTFIDDTKSLAGFSWRRG